MFTNIEPFKKLYAEFFSAVKDYREEICAFAAQIGKLYYDTAPKLLFVGQAVNGWGTASRDVEELFDLNNEDRVINQDNEIIWVEQENPSGWNANRSAFWKVIKRVTLELYGKEDWYNYIAWSNVYKLSPLAGRNPSENLINLQGELCMKILNEEMKNLGASPEVSSMDRKFIILAGVHTLI